MFKKHTGKDLDENEIVFITWRRLVKAADSMAAEDTHLPFCSPESERLVNLQTGLRPLEEGTTLVYGSFD